MSYCHYLKNKLVQSSTQNVVKFIAAFQQSRINDITTNSRATPVLSKNAHLLFVYKCLCDMRKAMMLLIVLQRSENWNSQSFVKKETNWNKKQKSQSSLMHKRFFYLWGPDTVTYACVLLINAKISDSIP